MVHGERLFHAMLRRSVATTQQAGIVHQNVQLFTSAQKLGGTRTDTVQVAQVQLDEAQLCRVVHLPRLRPAVRLCNFSRNSFHRFTRTFRRTTCKVALATGCVQGLGSLPADSVICSRHQSHVPRQVPFNLVHSLCLKHPHFVAHAHAPAGQGNKRQVGSTNECTKIFCVWSHAESTTVRLIIATYTMIFQVCLRLVHRLYNPGASLSRD